MRSFDPIWEDLQILPTHCCTPKENQPVILAARAHTDQQDHAVHQAGMTLSLRKPTMVNTS